MGEVWSRPLEEKALAVEEKLDLPAVSLDDGELRWFVGHLDDDGVLVRQAFEPQHVLAVRDGHPIAVDRGDDVYGEGPVRTAQVIVCRSSAPPYE